MSDNIPLHEPGIRKLPVSKCLECGHSVNAAGNPNDPNDLAQPNDLCVCMHCGAVQKFAIDMTLRGLSEAEMDELLADHEWMDNLASMVKRVHLLKHIRG